MGLLLQVIFSQWFGACALSVEKVSAPEESHGNAEVTLVMITHY